VRRQLASVLAATTALVVISLLIPLALAVRTIPRDRAISRAQLLSISLVQATAAIENQDRLAALVNQASDLNSGRLSLLLPDGQIVGDPFPPSEELMRAKAGTASTTERSDGVELLTPAVSSSGTAVVRVFVPDSTLNRGVARAWLILSVLGLLLIAVAVAVADRLGSRLTTPIVDLASTTRALAQGDLAARVVPSGPHEIADVGQTLNLLAERIGGLVTTERETLADLSHRLRTPITALRLDAENLRDPEESARIASDVDELTRSVDQLIRSARAPIGDRPTATDVAKVVTERLNYWSALADEQGRKVRASLASGPIWVGVTAEDLEAAIDVLIDNIFSHTDEPTPFSITLVTDHETVALHLDDAGPGLVEEELQKRMLVGSGVGSTGLGVSIAERTARTAGGRLLMGPSQMGGLRVTMVMPRLFHHVGGTRPRIVSERFPKTHMN
jgi:signal transduction histidine kinase